VAQELHFAILRIEVTRASYGLSAIAELLVGPTNGLPKIILLHILAKQQNLPTLQIAPVGGISSVPPLDTNFNSSGGIGCCSDLDTSPVPLQIPPC